ncbi:histidine phosphatase family protein [Viridibacillus sp. YIM B01967]|uniref:Histidine phosphatase family protein n=1 Tax=Viridibacillus soli TaxID=2798301 RepID=A0ABS1HB41_9BACL|nr:histidine phosphatase family protein [Viridibacillus soli]MBK3496637.1 histidine phosphatase family protein [Viridibacillus soli]
MVTLYITRHGQTEWNVAKRMQGWSDSPLTERGQKDAVKLGNKLKDIPFSTVYISPSGRTIQTAEILLKGRDVTTILDNDLREINTGDWQGMTLSDIEATYPTQYADYFERPEQFQPASGESFHDVKKRVLAALARIIEANGDGNILIVTHSVVKKLLINYFKGNPLNTLWNPPFIHGTSLTIVEIDSDGQAILKIVGDTTHFK